jgi:subtilisin family serine protease
VISVAAIDSSGALASFSNYGAKNVHIGAPGVQILSTLPGGQYGYMSGTSMATPHVTGAVALYASTHLGASAQAIRDAILGAAAPTPSLVGKTITGGRLIIANIVKPIAATRLAPTGLTATVGANGAVKLNWNAVVGATSYTIKRSATVNGPYAPISTVNGATTYTDTSANGGSRFFYLVGA